MASGEKKDGEIFGACVHILAAQHALRLRHVRVGTCCCLSWVCDQCRVAVDEDNEPLEYPEPVHEDIPVTPETQSPTLRLRGRV